MTQKLLSEVWEKRMKANLTKEGLAELLDNLKVISRK
jgi:hypothetical protein